MEYFVPITNPVQRDLIQTIISGEDEALPEMV